MKTTKFLLLLIIVFHAPAAHAWNLNRSYLNPALEYNNPTCGNGNPITAVPDGTVQKKCCLDDTCSANTPYEQKRYTFTVKVPRVNELCYHPSCYYRAANSALRFPMPVQPLTIDTSIIKNVIAGLTPGDVLALTDKVGAQVNYTFNYSYPVDFTFTNLPGIYRYGKSLNYMQKWDVSTGTSAMQGLLWSWRMMSKNWHGIWGIRSNYETSDADMLKRSGVSSLVPNDSSAKNIIIISDGIDSDGPAYRDGKVSTAIQNPANDGSVGMHKKDENDSSPIFETCDAHAPVASITDKEYDDTCKLMNAQGIKVYAILYGVPKEQQANNRLAKCAETTGGKPYFDVTPDNIQSTLSTLVASIATRNIRLIK